MAGVIGREILSGAPLGEARRRQGSRSSHPAAAPARLRNSRMYIYFEPPPRRRRSGGGGGGRRRRSPRVDLSRCMRRNRSNEAANFE